MSQALQGFRHPMDGMGRQYPKSVRQLLVGNEDSALRDGFEKYTRPCMRRHPIVLPENSASSAAKVTRLASQDQRLSAQDGWSCSDLDDPRVARFSDAGFKAE
jgi:hypothetical protein